MAKRFSSYKTKETKTTNARNTKKAPQMTGVELLKQCLEKEESQKFKEALETLSNLDDIQNIADSLFRTEYGINDMMSAIERTDKDTPSYAEKDLQEMCKYLANINVPVTDIDVLVNIVAIEQYFSNIVKDNDGKKDNALDRLMKVIHLKEYGTIDGVLITDRIAELTVTLTTAEKNSVSDIKKEISELDKIQDDIFMAGLIMIIRDTMRYYNEKVKELESAEGNETKESEATTEKSNDESKDIVIEDVTDETIDTSESSKDDNKVIDVEIVSEETVTEDEKSDEKSQNHNNPVDTLAAMNMILAGVTELMKNVDANAVIDMIGKLASGTSKDETKNIGKVVSDVVGQVLTATTSNSGNSTREKNKSTPDMKSILDKLGGVKGNPTTKEEDSNGGTIFFDNSALSTDDEEYRRIDPKMMSLLDKCGKHCRDIILENTCIRELSTREDNKGANRIVKIAEMEDHERNLLLRLYENVDTHKLYTMRLGMRHV